MNMKFGIVAGAAVACAVMTGCKAPKAQNVNQSSNATQVVVAEPAPATNPQPESKPAAAVQEPVRCKCAPGTVHTAPCACGVADCKCKVKPAEPEYTLYRVKGGDMLSAICATYGLKQSKVLDLNPGMDANKLYVGKMIKLPGKINLKEADVKSLEKKSVSKKPAKSAKAAKSSGKVASYKGATKDYTVASGDTLGKIAYANGITIKCLKEMNGLKKNTIRIGQKLKVPAGKPVAKVKADPKKDAEIKVEPKNTEQPKPAGSEGQVAPDPVKDDEKTAPAVAPDSEPVSPVVTPDVVPPAQQQEEAAQPAPALTHTVKAGEDTVSIAIQYSVSPSAIMDLNDLKNTDTLTPGQVLKLPANAKLQ